MPLATVDGGERRGRRTREEGRSDRQRTGRGTYSWVHERLTRSDGEEEPGPGMMVIISGPPWAPRLDLAGLGERRVDEEASASLEAESMTRYRREKGALRKRPARRVVVRLGANFFDRRPFSPRVFSSLGVCPTPDAFEGSYPHRPPIDPYPHGSRGHFARWSQRYLRDAKPPDRAVARNCCSAMCTTC